jgi:2-polyprenyl-6-methoxyphenol hydroxylase-like FAD-dependent oxidoreductase
MTTVLAAGASIAGIATARWVTRHGFTVTVVEHHNGLRRGGQAIDVRGPALTVLARMGIHDAAAEHKTACQGMSLVDAAGAKIARNRD